jgi:hypothetical protein
MTEKAMFDVDIGFTTDNDIRVFTVEVADQIESKDDGAVAAVFEGYDATVCSAILYSSKDICDRDLRGERDFVLVESVQSSL